MEIIKVNNLSVNYGDIKAIENITFNINKGDFLNIIGPNGGGKTTLVQVLTNLIKPSNGSFSFNEENIGYLPQNLAVKKNFPITVKEVILSGNDKKFYNKIDRWMEMMDIKNLKNKNIDELSGGEAQRVFLVRTLQIGRASCRERV